ncbi:MULTISPECIES: ROK family protein [Sphingomonas]|jgi:predicted NBD/HSP70 family sugar kinase|uniref:ROK family protein n=1 Tax=Sphingomonas TaxID=13687 RepID=UPI001AE48C10
MDSQPQTVRRRKASLSGTNLELTGDYNQRLVYQAVRVRGPITRNALIELTGLAKPTIAGIVRRLLGSELVIETSRIFGARGQPAVHLEVNPEGCYSVGLQVDDDRLDLVSIDALGNPVSRGVITRPASSGERAKTHFRTQYLKLTEDIRRDRIIGLGVAMVGSVSRDGRHADPGDGDIGIDLLALSDVSPGVPIYVDSALAAATAGESLFGVGASLQSYYYILMGPRPVGGLVAHEGLFKGAHPETKRYLFPGAEPAWCRQAVAADRMAALPACEEAWLAAAAADLIPLLTSINCMLNPGGVLLGGRFPDGWLTRLAERCNTLLLASAPEIPSHAGIQPARLARDATLIGAASLPMRARLFPIGEALLKAHDHVG